jgi:hypothetical protein
MRVSNERKALCKGPEVVVGARATSSEGFTFSGNCEPNVLGYSDWNIDCTSLDTLNEHTEWYALWVEKGKDFQQTAGIGRRQLEIFKLRCKCCRDGPFLVAG